MSNTIIQLRHSYVTGNVPSSLANGEIAINTYDGKLFYRGGASNTIQTIERYQGPAGLNGEIQFNDSGVLGSDSDLSFNKTTDVLSVKNVVISGNSYFGNANLHEGITQLSVTNNGASAYLFDQYSGNNPSLYVGAGETISFNLNVSGHPFVIRESSGGANTSAGLTHISTTGVVTTGADAQGKVSGVLFWKVPFSLVGSTYVYQCTIHGGMVGNIVIQQPASFVASNTALAFNTANAAFIRANNSIDANNGGTITGNLNITGTLDVTGNVTTSNYFIGDGSKLTGLAPALQIYNLANTASGVSGYMVLKSLAAYSVGTQNTTTKTVTTTPTLLTSFITDVGFPNITSIPSGDIIVEFDTQKASGVGGYYCYAEIYKRTVDGTETLIATTGNSSSSTLNSQIQQRVNTFVSTPIILDISDRIVVKIYAVMLTTSASISIYFDGAADGALTLPVLPASTLNFVPYINATANVQLNSYSLIAQTVSANSVVVLGRDLNAYVNSAFLQANTPSYVANSASVYANGAFARANNSLNANTGGTVTANVAISANLTAANVSTQTYIQFGDGSKQYTANAGGGGGSTSSFGTFSANGGAIIATTANTEVTFVGESGISVSSNVSAKKVIVSVPAGFTFTTADYGFVYDDTNVIYDYGTL